MNERLLSKLRQVTLRDIGHLFLFLAALLPSAIFKMRRPDLWLICESANEARDNGYWLFRFLCRERPQVDAVYAICRTSPDYAKVASLGQVVEYGSFRHWVYYLAAKVNLSSQKSGKPNAAVCYLLEVVLGVWKNRRVFLQHGVTTNDLPFLYREKAKFSLFCCSAPRELEWVRNRFGYPPEAVQMVGLCRFDALHGLVPDQKLVLILPTWRMYLQRQHGAAAQMSFLHSRYYACWEQLLHAEAFASLLQAHGKHAIFLMHRNMQAFEGIFTGCAPCIDIVRWEDVDVSALIRQAGTLVTDYSSIQMDFGYLERPLIYYQFDQEEFRRSHLAQGYFRYEEDGFGPVCKTAAEVLTALSEVFERGCQMEPAYRKRVEQFYTLRDTQNCERTYDAVVKLLENHGEDHQ